MANRPWCGAMRCGRSVPKYQITGVWTELPERAAPSLEFLLVIHGKLRKANKSIRWPFLPSSASSNFSFFSSNKNHASFNWLRGEFLQNFLRFKWRAEWSFIFLTFRRQNVVLKTRSIFQSCVWIFLRFKSVKKK